jgi:SagB-type dehydrogenase family enzyme
MQHLKSTFFLKNIGGKWILWDYESHRQFELDADHFNALYNYSSGVSQSEKSTPAMNFRLSGILQSNPSVGPSQWGWDELSEIFHQGTSDVQPTWLGKTTDEFIQKYINFSSEISAEYCNIPIMPVSKESITLAEVDTFPTENICLLNALRNRRTVRDFNSIGIKNTFINFSSLLRLAFGPVHGIDPEFKALNLANISERKFSPSPGNIHPEEIFVQINSIEAIAPGMYYYHQERQMLVPCADAFTQEELQAVFLGQFFHQNSDFVIFIVSRFDRLWWKYKHSRTYRMAHIGAGHLSQTFHILAPCYGFGTWMTGHFHDSTITKKLCLPKFCHPLFIVAGGRTAGKSIPEEFASQMSQ